MLQIHYGDVNVLFSKLQVKNKQKIINNVNIDKLISNFSNYRYDITEILLKVTLKHHYQYAILFICVACGVKTFNAREACVLHG
jgi:hypothetical protein